MAKKILVIAPHADDEILGCGGYLLHEKEKGSEIRIVFGTIGGTHKLQNKRVRLNEADFVCKTLGADYTVMVMGKDAELDTIGDKEIVTFLDNYIDSYRPDEVFINYPSLHQDHKKIYECSITSMRLREGYSPKLVALYEYPFILNQGIKVEGGRWYHNISDVIDRKIKIFLEGYKTQVKNYPSPLNEEGIKILSNLRGYESGHKNAELFYIVKEDR